MSAVAMNTGAGNRSSWLGCEVQKSEFCHELIADHLMRIDALLPRLSGKDVTDIVAADFADPALAGFMAGVAEEIRSGRGLVVITGASPPRYSDDELAKIFWGLGTYLGVADSQSIFGEKLGHVRKSLANPTDRGYRSDRELYMHTDSTGIAALLSLHRAKSGGISQFASSLAVHDEIARRRPDLLKLLYQGYPYHLAGEQPPGVAPITPYNVPVFANVDGLISCKYLRAFINMAGRELPGGIPAPMIEALDFFDGVASRGDVKIEFYLEPGEMAFLNNFTILHARAAFEDFPEPELRRHLLRLWLGVPDLRPTPAEMDIHGPGGIKGQPDLVKHLAHVD